MTNTITHNKNPLAISTGFKMVFSRAPNVSYFCQNFMLPSVSSNEAVISRPRLDAYVPGDKLVFEPLTLNMLISEDMENYEEILDWMIKGEDQVDDITLYILSSKNNVNKTVMFKNAFPTSLGSITFNIQDADITYAQVDVTFRYDYFEFADARGLNAIKP